MTQGRKLDKSGSLGANSSFGASETLPLPSMNFFRQPLAPILMVVGVAVLVVLAVTFARVSGQIAILWGAGGLAAAVWLRAGRGLAFDMGFGALVFVGVLAGELLVGHGPRAAFAYTFFNLVEIILAVILTRRYLPGLSVESVEGIARFFGISLVSALVGALGIGLANRLGWFIQTEEIILRWWSAHAMGMALIGVFGLALKKSSLKTFIKPLRLAEGLLLIGMIAAACYTIFGQLQLPYSFMLMPLIVLMAVRFRVVGTALSLILISVLAMSGTIMGLGPYRLFPADVAPLVIHLLMLLGYAPLMMVAALLEERERLHALARREKERAELASAAKSRLLANVAHEIKSPVSGIIGIGELWAAGQRGNWRWRRCW